MSGESPFLVEPSEWLASNRSAVALEDRYPVSRGHSLVVPRRLVSAWWDLSHDERQDVWSLVDALKLLIDNRYGPDGYNVGFNGGAAAGQTVEHFHIHVIPRYVGDVPDARGGIRWVIPDKAGYLSPGADSPEVASSATSLVDSRGRVMKLELLRCLLNDQFDRVDLLVSFIMQSGLRLIERQLDGALDRGADVRVLTTDYLNVTHPDALSRLMDLQRTADTRLGRGTLDLRVFEDPVTSFHPKAYLFWSSARQTGRGFVGSNNLSRAGIEHGVEWSMETRDVRGLVEAFEELWADPRNRDVDEDWLDGYRGRYAAAARVFPDGPVAIPEADPEPEGNVQERPTPRPIQQDALSALEATREAGHRAGLVVMATGLGKTWLAAFDSNRAEFPRVLFIAHREEILTQARDVFRRVRPDARLGFFTSAEKAAESDVVFATVQTLHRHLGSFPVGDFEYVVVDEFHHASAKSYRKVINHFEPRFLLGLTATPERMDGADLLALCGDNLVFRCDLVDGIERRELAPFHYWGVADTVDFAPIPWRNGRFDPAALEAAVATKERADAAFREWSARRGERTLAFCASIRHADYMAEHFASQGVPSESLHSRSGAHARQMAIERLETGDLSVLFTVDLFNEGVDMPTLDTVLMLRPTESPVVFLQQLGRGLRVALGKDHLDVVDFVGNHRGFLAPLRTLLSLRLGRPPTAREIADALRDKSFELPEGCSVDYSLHAVELLNALIRERRSGADDVLRDICLQIAEEDGCRPSALQVALAGGNVRAARARAGGWFEFLAELDLLNEEELRVLAETGEFLREIAVTPMTKSFKMVLLQALLRHGSLRSSTPVPDLAAQSLQLMQGDPRLAADVDTSEISSIRVVETTNWQKYWERNPIAAWTGGPWFEVRDGHFSPRFQVSAELGDAFDAMVAELVEWRLHAYFTSSREASASDGRPVLRLFHASGSPILRLDRARYPDLPVGPTEFLADGERFTGHFVKIALNKVTRGSESANVLPGLLRRWFGPAAGLPGTSHSVVLERGPAGWSMSPLRVGDQEGDAETLPHFPSYAVACGAFSQPVPSDAAPRRQALAGGPASENEFLVTVRGESMSGSPTALHHGDLARMRWATETAPATLIGKPVLVELQEGRETLAALKVLDRDRDGFILRSTADGFEDQRASGSMTVVGEFVERVDPSLWNPLQKWIGQAFRRADVATMLGRDPSRMNQQSGHVTFDEDTVFFVKLEKSAGEAGSEYRDEFESPEIFRWTSQNSTTPENKRGREVLEALDTGQRIHLFVRKDRKHPALTYCGLLAPLRHEGSAPMSVWFRLLTPLSPELQRQLAVADA